MLYIIFGIVLVVLLAAVLLYNGLVKARNLTQTALSDIDVHLTKRFSLVPNLVSLTKSYAHYESELLLEIVSKRSGKTATESLDEKAAADRSLTDSLQKISIVAENYPELKADKQFLQLMEDLSFIENDLVYSRRFYNGAVRDLNNRIQSFPNNLVAGMFGFQAQPFYKVGSESEREVPVIH